VRKFIREGKSSINRCSNKDATGKKIGNNKAVGAYHA